MNAEPTAQIERVCVGATSENKANLIPKILRGFKLLCAFVTFL